MRMRTLLFASHAGVCESTVVSKGPFLHLETITFQSSGLDGLSGPVNYCTSYMLGVLLESFLLAESCPRLDPRDGRVPHRGEFANGNDQAGQARRSG